MRARDVVSIARPCVGVPATARYIIGLQCCAALACTGSSSLDTPAPEGPAGVLIVSIDGLRADALGAYDRDVAWTPNLDGLASSSWVFRDVVSQAPSTLESHRSVFLSMYPHLHGTSITESGRMPIESPMMRLRARGFRTAGFVGSGQMLGRFGWDQEFEDFQDRISETDELRRTALQWLRNTRDQPFVLFLHTYAVHCPFTPAQPYRSQHAGWYTGSLQTEGKCGIDFNEMDLDPEDVRYLRDLYAAEVEMTDAFLGDLFEGLEQMGLFERTLIVVMSDHGESLGERGFIGHNQLLPVHLAVPLIIKVPGRAPALVDAPAQNLDILPTIFDVLGLESPYPFQGRSLVEVAENVTEPDMRVRVAEQVSGRAAVIRDRWHMVLRRGRRAGPRLYDRVEDPEALVDRARSHPEVVASLIQEYDVILAQDARYADLLQPRQGGRTQLEDEVIKELRVLGYVQ